MKTSVARKTKNKDLKFPCLMISECGSIYYITGTKDNYNVTGIKIHCGDNGADDHRFGQYYDLWNLAALKPYCGSVTLSDDDD